MIEVRFAAAPSCALYAATRPDGAAVAIVETVDDTGVVQQLVDAAAALVPPGLAAAAWPRRFGDSLHALMLEAAAAGRLPSPGPFAAAAIGDGRIHALTAGSVRVHAFDGASLVGVTRDHILRTEPGDAPAAVLVRHGTTPSRAIGGSRYHPEPATWPATAPIVIVCTEDVHGFRDPASYAAAYAAGAGEPITGGAIAIAGVRD